VYAPPQHSAVYFGTQSIFRPQGCFLASLASAQVQCCVGLGAACLQCAPGFGMCPGKAQGREATPGSRTHIMDQTGLSGYPKEAPVRMANPPLPLC